MSGRLEHMFESWTTVDAPEGVGPRWSACVPDGLLAEMLSYQAGGSSAEHLERIGAWERLIAFAQAAQLREIARFVAAAEADPAFGDDPEQVHASVCAAIGSMVRVPARTAAGRVDDSIALVKRLPNTLAALSAGVINMSSARAILEETICLGPAPLADIEAHILEHASGQTTGQIRASAKRVVARADAEAVRRRAEQARRERCVRLIPEPDGMATVAAYLPAQQAVAVIDVLDDCARRAAGSSDRRSMAARRADALVDLVLDSDLLVPAGTKSPAVGAEKSTGGSVDSDGIGSRPGGRESSRRVGSRRRGSQVQIRVTVALTTLLGLDQLPGELAGYGPIPADIARELAAEGTWRRLVTDPVSGALLDYGTTRYRPPPHLAEHVKARDRTCVYPGCRVPAHRCDIDHHVPHSDAGPTSAWNISSLCRSHHRLKHSPGWRVTRLVNGSVAWRTPTGHRLTREPPRLAEPEVAQPARSGDLAAMASADRSPF
jgi:hypothetical protein